MVFQIARRVAALDGGGNSAVDAVVMSVDSSIERRSPTANPATDPNYFEKTQLSLRGGQIEQSWAALRALPCLLRRGLGRRRIAVEKVGKSMHLHLFPRNLPGGDGLSVVRVR